MVFFVSWDPRHRNFACTLVVLSISALLLTLSHGTAGSDDGIIISIYEKLRNDLLKRPVVVHKMPPGVSNNFTRPYPLKFDLFVLDIHDLDEIRQAITIIGYIRTRWRHEDLSWDPADYDGIEEVWFDADLIWRPNCVAVLGLEDFLTIKFQGAVILSSNGTVTSENANYLSFGCNINFDFYPFDTQTCTLGLYPMDLLTQPEISVGNLGALTSTLYDVKGEWSVVSLHSEVVATLNEEISSAIKHLARFNFTVRRNPVFYLVTIMYPLSLTSLMTPLVFLIPAYAGEKISFLVAVFTSTAVFLNFISDVMPRSLPTLPHLALLLIEVLLESFLALLASILVVNRYHEEQLTPNKKNDRNKVSSSSDAFIHTEKAPDHVGSNSERGPATKSDATRNGDSRVRSRMWMCTSRGLDKIFFFVFSAGQVTFLTVLFVTSGWMNETLVPYI